jgi:phage terminase large subunit-like protein
MKSLAQLKIDARNNGWPWEISHPNDERALLNGCHPEFKSSERVREFFLDLLVVPQEGGGTKPFELIDWWYSRVLAQLFGWKRRDGRRRFDKGFVTTGKKSAKSTVFSGLPLYMIMADGEEEAEAYAAAVDRDQAGIIYKKTSRMVKLSPELSGVLTRVDSQKRIVYEETGGYFEAISSDADSAEGKNPHLLIADELHVWKDRQFFNSLMYGDIARSQPLFLMITTAGEDANGVGHEEYEFAKDLLNPNNDFYSESHFAFIAEASPEREWDDPEGWKEANPSLACGAIGSIEKLQSKCEEAKKTPRKKRDFIRYICNRWVSDVENPWLPEDGWQECGQEVPDHDGDPCGGGLDLSKSVDLTSLCLVFESDDFLDYKWWFWMPEDGIKEKEDRDRVPYRLWAEHGYIELTPGNVVDYDYIRRQISGVMPTADRGPNDEPKVGQWKNSLVNRFKINGIGYDPYNATKLVTELNGQDGIPMTEFRQGYLSMNQPSKEFERRVVARTIRHGNNPVVNWMAGHCVVESDASGNIKPSKKKSRHKIDGIVGAVMATGVLASAEPEGDSIYETPGNLRL